MIENWWITKATAIIRGKKRFAENELLIYKFNPYIPIGISHSECGQFATSDNAQCYPALTLCDKNFKFCERMSSGSSWGSMIIMIRFSHFAENMVTLDSFRVCGFSPCSLNNTLSLESTAVAQQHKKVILHESISEIHEQSGPSRANMISTRICYNKP